MHLKECKQIICVTYILHSVQLFLFNHGKLYLLYQKMSDVTLKISNLQDFIGKTGLNNISLLVKLTNIP